MRLCDSHLGILGLYDGKMYQTVAQRGKLRQVIATLSIRSFHIAELALFRRIIACMSPPAEK